MTLLQALAMMTTSPVALLRDVRESTVALEELGIEESEANWLRSMTETYFVLGHYKSKAAQVLRLISENGHTLNGLKFVEDYARKLSRKKAWQLRLAVFSQHPKNFADLKSIAKREHSRLKPPPRNPKKGVRITHHKGGAFSLNITGDPEHVNSMHEALKGLADPAATIVEKGHQPLHTNQGSDLSSDEKPRMSIPRIGADLVLHPIIQIPLDVADKVLTQPDGTVMLERSDGVRMSAMDFMASQISPEWGIALIHPVLGSVELGRAYRFASEKQRVLAMAEASHCMWGDCPVPAEHCQVHHIRAWKHEGRTDQENLVLLCPGHNLINNDDPGRASTFGHVIRTEFGFRRVYREYREASSPQWEAKVAYARGHAA